MKIYAPMKDFDGIRATVRFSKGVGETDDPRLIEWFKSHGYSLEKCDEIHEKPLEKCDDNLLISTENEQIESTNEQIDFESMTPNDLRDWAKANGLGMKIKNIRNKEKLLEIIRG